MARIYAVVFGSLGLCTALIRDMIHGVSPQDALLRGWIVLLFFSFVGAAIGAVAEQVLREAVEQRLRSQMAEKLNGASESQAERNK
ncbi:MAG TPA: hypothetical protein PL064_09355 [Thermogutta sp.]|nr:hypothetical protein [Thermogutta sp.]HPU05738.1 hypothetical protein [Thermogutta sp.]HPZ83631.1 hypothetical protein [Thermogutta sp.]HQF14205.1 hypothetical protein [Thermogutta sp.]